MNKIRDLTGKKINRLTVAWPVGRNSGYTVMWLCFCDCGKTKIYSSNELVRKTKRSLKSCGCARRNPETSFHTLWLQYQQKARQRKYCWKLNYNQFKNLITSPCFYTGWKPQQVFKPKGINPSPPILYNGIDRVDNSKGYTAQNCVSCAGIVNKAKLNNTKEEFIRMCCAVANLHKEDEKMKTTNGGGDKLASGAVRAQFAPAGSSKTQKEWDDMWKDYVPEKSFVKPKRKKSTS